MQIQSAHSSISRDGEPAPHDHFGSDESTSVVQLRSDLSTKVEQSATGVCVIVEDLLADKFYRLGKTEFAFARLLDGRKTLSECYAELTVLYPEHSLRFSDATELCRWLIENDLAHTASSKSSKRFVESRKKRQIKSIKERSNPLSVKFNLVSLDSIATQLNRWIGWCFSPAMTFLSCLWMLVVFGMGLLYWDTLGAFDQFRISGSTVMLIAATTVVLKVVHELSHAIVCKRYGGRVGHLGILLILFAPLPFVDVSSVWRFRSRLQRVHVALAGIYTELLIASLAVCLAFYTDQALIQYVCSCVVISAGAMTLLFNANPLMRFDGYYALTDLLGWTDLLGDSQKRIGQLTRRFLFGDTIDQDSHTASQRLLLTVYGFAACSWKYLICTILLVTAAKLFHGAGLILTCLGIVAWIIRPSIRGWNTFRRRPVRDQRRASVIIGGCLIATTLVLLIGRSPMSIKSPAIVQYAGEDTVRAEVDGFIDTIHAQPGKVVNAGDILMTLRNPSLGIQADQLRIEIDQSDLETRRLLLQGSHAASQAKSARCEALRERLKATQQQLDALEVRARHRGVVVARKLSEKAGTYVRQGDELMIVSQDGHKELRALIAHTHVESLQAKLGQTIRYRVAGHPTAEGILQRINPRATEHCQFPELLSINSGPMMVRIVPDADSPRDRNRLVEPHFEAVISIPSAVSIDLRSGLRGSISLGLDQQSFARQLQQRFFDLW
ncbi:HlyD family efflux transporter periplasmic adaptor subunit [Stieleria sp. JC731]|uniref:HlyD family efflux transporter periplasmic adaptor subunit n=1 Tax=Pirellulaceae TaxID=2691357 RepID=UPI001E57AB26|nr:HlyD family efflux transporter periplasmic adaptor subunit [Stieleria sp. JC731]MCC9599920.1 HlyD family efflux transporter periplasmic adaptor subunit [Stieleria sp. JC731]